MASKQADVEAALAAVADSFGVHRSAVRLVSGASSRTKIVDIDAGDPASSRRCSQHPATDASDGMSQPSGRRS
jgi:hypothetical protein